MSNEESLEARQNYELEALQVSMFQHTFCLPKHFCLKGNLWGRTKGFAKESSMESMDPFKFMCQSNTSTG